MRASDFKRGRPLLVLIAGMALLACSSQNGTTQSVSAEPDSPDPIEASCELALLRLEELIEAYANSGEFSEVVLVEARELRQIGKELYLEQEYALALEFIEEGIRLLEGESN